LASCSNSPFHPPESAHPSDRGRIPFTGKPSFHRGMDFAAPEGTDIRPGSDREGHQSRISTGSTETHVVIDHDGTYQTLYGHMQKIFVRLNQQVSSTTILGVVGSTGYSTGPHLHFEILKDGQAHRSQASFFVRGYVIMRNLLLRFLSSFPYQAFCSPRLWGGKYPRSSSPDHPTASKCCKLENLLVLDLSPQSEFQSGSRAFHHPTGRTLGVQAQFCPLRFSGHIS
jgi:hypothetical protein